MMKTILEVENVENNKTNKWLGGGQKSSSLFFPAYKQQKTMNEFLHTMNSRKKNPDLRDTSYSKDPLPDIEFNSFSQRTHQFKSPELRSTKKLP